MTGGQKAVLWIFILTFALMIFSVIPWGDFRLPTLEGITLAGTSPNWPRSSSSHRSSSASIGKLGEEGMVGAIVAGMGDFMGAALIIALARGVTVVMNNAGITDTV